MEEADIYLLSIHSTCTLVLPFLQVLLSTFSNLPKTGNFFPQLACSCNTFLPIQMYISVVEFGGPMHSSLLGG